LSQNHHPIAFFSKKLNPRMQRQPAYDGRDNIVYDGFM
jgi:hypothetical protein